MLKKILLLTAAVCSMAACSDDDPINIPSAVDEKDWTLDANMDTRYKPGDNFYMYCNGYWHNHIDMNGYKVRGTINDEAPRIVNERMAHLDNATINTFKAHVRTAGTGENAAAAEAAIRANLRTVQVLAESGDATGALVQAIALGYDKLLDAVLYPVNGKLCMMPTHYDAGNWKAITARRLRPTAPTAAALLDRLTTAAPASDLSLTDAEARTALRRRLQPAVSTRSSDATLLARLADALDINLANIYVDKKMKPYLETLAEATPQDIAVILSEEILYDLAFTSPERLAAYNQTNGTTLTLKAYSEETQTRYMPYIISHAYATRYVTPERRQTFQEICEEMRAVFRETIGALDWMSHTTKQNAIDKLDAMRFNVGYPDEWLPEGLPTLTGTSLGEDVLQLRTARRNLYHRLAGADAQDAGFNYLISDTYDGMPLMIVNSCYIPDNNSMNIFPVFMLEPFYAPHLSDAFNYATFTVIGHEITHGFDNNGSQYDKIGSLKDWWTVSDKMEFKKRQQKLIDCYNLLEIQPDDLPGVYANGEKTLGENIADLGGLKMAYQAYMRRLARDGFTGDEAVKQEKRFLQAYANLWRCRRTPENALEQLRTNVHASGKERVNGVMMNFDRWYQLYDVQWGDHLYLPTERRTYIW